MPKSITVYSRKTCAPCAMLKRWLNVKGYNYSEISVDDQPDKMDDVVRLSGYAMVPCTVVALTDGTEKVVPGYNLNSLSAILK